MNSSFRNLFKPIGPETVTSNPPRTWQGSSGAGSSGSTFPLNEFLLALAFALVGALVVAGALFGFSGSPNELMGENLGNMMVAGVAATLGSFVGGMLAGGSAKELVGPFSAVPVASILLVGIWAAAGVTDSLLLLTGATFIPMGAGVAVGFLVRAGVQTLAEKAKRSSV
ncbi:MAG: hypothetical protein WD602_00705 [Actinomycetota bacterium]